MARWQPVTNLRSRIIHHPPVTVFFMCLLVLAGAFVGIGIYSQSHDIKNPDILMDWNQMLGSLANFKFCTQLNNTDLTNEKPDINSPLLLTHADELLNSTQKKSEVISKFLLVPLMHLGDHLEHNSWEATMLGSQLGLKGFAGKQSINISLFLDIQTRISPNHSTIIQKPSRTQVRSPVVYDSCLKITAPSHVLPQTPSPPQCPVTKNIEKNMASVRALAVQSFKSLNALPCLSLQFTPDAKLTVLLTQDEKVLARYHLLLVSIALLSLCITMCFLGTLTCSNSHRHILHDSQKETLLE